MGFSQDVKQEIIKNLPFKQECRQSFLSALIKYSGEYGITGGNLAVIIKTQIESVFDIVENYAQNYGLKVEKEIDHAQNFFKMVRYQITISGDKIKDFLLNLNILSIFDDEQEAEQDKQTLDRENINQGDANAKIEPSFVLDSLEGQKEVEGFDIKSYIKGAFIACGSVSGVNENGKKSVDYHLEWVFTSMQKAENFIKYLSQINILGRVVKRKKLFVVYLQKFEVISDMLVLFDAQENMLKLNNEYAKRSVMNSVNRQSNCDTANMAKVIDNSLSQLKAIALIQNTIGLENIGDDLASVCMLRLANVEESLQELATLAGMSKSALNYRFSKIMKIAKEIQEEQN